MTEGQKGEVIILNGEVVKFNYLEVVADHYKYRGAVYNHNSLRHDDGTKSQNIFGECMGNDLVAHPIFAFFIACAEVNTYPSMKYFLKTDDSFMHF